MLPLLVLCVPLGCARTQSPDPPEHHDLMGWLVWRQQHPPATAAPRIAVPRDLLLVNRSTRVLGETVSDALRGRTDLIRRVEYLESPAWKHPTGEELEAINAPVERGMAAVRAERLRQAARDRGCALLVVFEARSEDHGLVKPDRTEWGMHQQLRAALVDVESGAVLDLAACGSVWRESLPTAERHARHTELLRQHARPIAEALVTELLDGLSPGGPPASQKTTDIPPRLPTP